MIGSVFEALMVVSFTAASDTTGQWETRSALEPAWKNALARPERPSAPPVPSAATVLHADRMTQSASQLQGRHLARRQQAVVGPNRQPTLPA